MAFVFWLVGLVSSICCEIISVYVVPTPMISAYM